MHGLPCGNPNPNGFGSGRFDVGDIGGANQVPKGVSIHVGLNSVDRDQYDGWDGHLVACEFDANDMEVLAGQRGFDTRKLMTAEATSEALLTALGTAADALVEDDILLVTYSGHGGQVPDRNGDETDQMDETWVLYDRQVVDDELYAVWARFKPGVRIAVFSDSCHSGTVVRDLQEAVRPEALSRAVGAGADGAPRMRAMPTDVSERVYRAHKKLYDDIQKEVPPLSSSDVQASVLLLSGCQDNQTSADGDRNGLFTQTLLGVWDEGRFKGGYRTFGKRIAAKMPPWQSPNFYTEGSPNRGFEREHPFSV